MIEVSRLVGLAHNEEMRNSGEGSQLWGAQLTASTQVDCRFLNSNAQLLLFTDLTNLQTAYES